METLNAQLLQERLPATLDRIGISLLPPPPCTGGRPHIPKLCRTPRRKLGAIPCRQRQSECNLTPEKVSLAALLQIAGHVDDETDAEYKLKDTCAGDQVREGSKLRKAQPSRECRKMLPEINANLKARVLQGMLKTNEMLTLTASAGHISCDLEKEAQPKSGSPGRTSRNTSTVANKRAINVVLIVGTFK